MPTELLAPLAQWGAVGLILAIAVATIMGRGIVSRRDYERALKAAEKANETTAALSASLDRLTASVQALAASQVQLLALSARTPDGAGR